MRNFTKKSILQKIMISILAIILLMNLIFPNMTIAKDSDVGGALFSPIQALIMALGDGIMILTNKLAGYSGYSYFESPILKISQDGNNIRVSYRGLSPVLVDTQTGATVGPPIAGGNLLYHADLFAELFGGDVTETINSLPDSIEIPMFNVSPEKIFSNQVDLINANIINPTKGSIARDLQSIVSGWYIDFRNLAIVGLLSVLVYIGIRIIISSTAADKSRYKEMFFDWVIAFCLLFFMHYIMSFSITIVEIITKSISASNQSIAIPITVDEIDERYGLESDEKEILNQITVDGTSDSDIKLSLMEYVRFRLQLEDLDIRDENGDLIVVKDGTGKMAYTIIYFTLVIYTVMFLFIYIKRVIYIIFLTMMAPLVALTYPIDKLRDGKAQGFNIWLKEYIFNLLLQPVHLLLYTVLLGTTIELASEYLIYPLVVLGCMLPAEKIIRKFFGFESSSTASSLMSGALGGALVMQGINALGRARKGKSGKGGSESKADGNNDRSKIRMANRVGPNKRERDDYAINAITGENTTVQQTLNASRGTESGATRVNRAQRAARTAQGASGTSIQRGNSTLTVRTSGNENSAGATRRTSENGLSTSRTSNGKVKKGTPRWIRGTKAVAGKYIGPNLKKLGVGALKAIPKAYGAAALGTIGVAAGLASDDFSNVVKYGAAAGVVGGSLGGSLANKIEEIPGEVKEKAGEVRDTWEKAYYDKEDYKEVANRRADEKFVKNKEIRKRLQEDFKGFKDANGNTVDIEDLVKAALEYDRQGVNLDIAVKAMKTKSDYASADLADPRRISAAQMSMTASSKDDYKEVREGLKRTLGEDKYEEKKDIIEDQINMIRQINDNLL